MPHLFSFKVIFGLLILLAIEISLMPVFQLFFLKPVFMYLFVFYATMEWTAEKSLKLAALVGAVRDFTLSPALGMEILALVPATFLLLFFIQKMDRRSPLSRIVTAFLFVFMILTFNLILQGLAASQNYFSAVQLGHIFWTAVSSAFLMPFVLIVISHWFGGRQPSLKQYELFS